MPGQYSKYPPATLTSAITSINGNTTAAQLIVGGSGITVGTSAGTTTITNTLVSGNQSANTVYAGPTTGPAAPPTFRALVSADIPSLSSIYLPLAGGTMTGALLLAAGTVGAPSLRLTGDTTTGWYQPAANQWAYARSGVKGILLNQPTFGTGTNLWISQDLSGLGIGVDPTTTGFANLPNDALNMTVSSSFANAMSAYCFRNNTTAPSFITGKSRGTLASPSAVLNQDFLGQHIFRGWDGTSMAPTNGSAQMAAVAQENWTSTTRGTSFFFDTTPIGSASLVATVSISQDGSLRLRRNSSSAGLFFENDGVADIGAVASLRPRSIYAFTSVVAPTFTSSLSLTTQGGVKFNRASDNSSVGALDNVDITSRYFQRYSAATTISGFSGDGDGQKYMFQNNTGLPITLLNENAGSTAANRIHSSTGADITVLDQQIVSIYYLSAINRWVVQSVY